MSGEADNYFKMKADLAKCREEVSRERGEKNASMRINHPLRERIHQLEAERDEAKKVFDMVAQDLHDSTKRITALEAGLRKYGRHLPDCELQLCTFGCQKDEKHKCTCDLTDLIEKSNG